jgi:hypothetical protein
MQAGGVVVTMLGLALAATVAATLTGCSAGDSPTSAAPAPASAPESPAPPAPSAKLGPLYSSPDGYRISPPEGWLRYPIPTPKGTSVAFSSTTLDSASNRPFADNLSVIIIPSGRPVEALVADIKREFGSRVPSFRVVTDQPIRLPDGQPAHLLSSTFNGPKGTPQQNLQLLAVRAGKAYAVTFTATAGTFAGLRALFQQSLSSFALD